MYLEHNEHLALPGSGSLGVNPAPKVVADSDDFKRRVAVRQSLASLAPEAAPHAAQQDAQAAPAANGASAAPL